MRDGSDMSKDLEDHLREDAAQYATQEPALGFHRRMVRAVEASAKRRALHGVILRWAVSFAVSIVIGMMVWKQTFAPQSPEGAQWVGSEDASSGPMSDPRSLGRLRSGLSGDPLQALDKATHRTRRTPAAAARPIRNHPADRREALSELFDQNL